MIEAYRRRFNGEQFSAGRYAELKASLNRITRTEIEFRICETPCFFPRELLDEMIETGRVLTHQLIDSPEYMARSEEAIPAQFKVPNDNRRPNFMTVDFGLVREGGRLKPKLVELQAFPSIYGYQDVLVEEYRRAYGLADELTGRLGGLSQAQYWALLRETIVGDHAPENVVLMEVEPEGQKTLPDFHVYQDRLGIGIADVAKVRKEGKTLFYERDGRWVRIERIFNRAIVDEMERKGVRPAFDYRDELAVEWAGQPNWYFRASKFSLPFLEHEAVPRAVFLDQWMDGVGRELIPEDREQVLLKPLYSFAGKGIEFGPTDAELAAIPAAERKLYLLQERVKFEPTIETPWGLTQAEVRIMYVWPEGRGEMQAVQSLVRLGRGLMMGVDHNRNQEWIGGSAAFFPEGIQSL